MSAELAAHVAEDYLTAYNAEREGNLIEALRLYRLVWGGMAGNRVLEKDGLRVERGTLEAKIRDLELQVGKTTGGGQLKRVNITYQRPGCDTDDNCYCR